MISLKPFRFPTLKEYRNNRKNAGTIWSDAYGHIHCEKCGKYFQPGETSYPIKKDVYTPVEHYHKNCGVRS